MTASDTSIANMALAKMGHEGLITSLSENSKGARYINVFYEPIRDALLRDHLWRFARSRAILAPLSATPAFDGGRYFQYPDDCLRIVGTDKNYFYSGERWLREGDKIIADDDVLNIVYIKKITDASLFDASFVDVFSSRLAYEAALPITKSQSVKEQMEKEYRRSVIRAARASATEQDGEKFISEAFIGVR